jgi:transcriptional antiterminator RfaH
VSVVGIEVAAAPRWYVVRSNFKQERLARASLAGEGLDAYLPLLPKTSRKGELYATPLFPSFLFVAFALGGVGWTRIFTARGVQSVLGTAGKPMPIASFGVEQIRARELSAFARAQLAAPPCRTLTVGEVVRFKKGPWAELDAVFLEQVDARRCTVLLRLLGSARPAEAELAHIE